MLSATVTPIGTRPDFVREAGTDAIDEQALRRFMVSQGAEFSFGDGWPTDEDLLAARVVRDVFGTLRPTLYGLMVFGKDPQSHASTADLYTECAAHDGNDRRQGPFRAAGIRGRIEEQVAGAVRWFESLERRKPWRGASAEGSRLLPAAVLREALVNALTHRDYGLMGTHATLDVFPDRVEVTSPGGLPYPMTVERVRGGGVARSRNEEMVSAMVVAGLAGRRGTGWLLMRRRMREFNGTEPELTSVEGRFTRVTFRTAGSQ